jgi:hypothetical protein
LPGSANLRAAVRRTLVRESGANADAGAVAAALVRVHDTFARHLALLIGDGGVRALSARSLHLVQRDFPWLAEVPVSGSAEELYTRLGSSLEAQEPAVAAEAAVAALATLGGLLETLIGEALTLRVLRDAWPTTFAEGIQQEA